MARAAGTSRRVFLQQISALTGVSQLEPRSRDNASASSIVAELRLRPFINAAGAYTDLGGARMSDAVIDGMRDIAHYSVSIRELQQVVGGKIAAMLRCEAALVTSGCASALTLATAACAAGSDPEKIRRLPDINGCKTEVIIQESHRFDYDHAIRNVGVRLVEVETAEQLRVAVNERTAMLFFLNSANEKGRIQREEFASLSRSLRIPSLVDAAADLPPAENLWSLTRLGFDLVAFSGGKSLRGPQCSGLLLGKKDLVQAAFLNGPPHSDSLGRISKVGKEEIVGLYRAVQSFVAADHNAEWREWERRVANVARELAALPGVTATQVVPPIPHNRPQVRITWDMHQIPLTSAEIGERLRAGVPRIELPPSQRTPTFKMDVAVWMLRPGEDFVIGRRIREELLRVQNRVPKVQSPATR